MFLSGPPPSTIAGAMAAIPTPAFGAAPSMVPPAGVGAGPADPSHQAFVGQLLQQSPGLLQHLMGGGFGAAQPAIGGGLIGQLANSGSANGATGSGGDSTGGVSGTGGVGGSATDGAGGSAAAGVGGDDGGTY